MEAGMNDYLTKPIERGAFHGILTRWLPQQLLPTETLVTEENDSAHYAELPYLEGVDPEKGVRRVGGSAQRYMELLGEFARRYDHTGEQLRIELQEGKIDDAARRVHSVLGAANALGAFTLSEAASALESTLRSQDSDEAERVFIPFEHIHQKLCADIMQFFEQNPTDDMHGTEPPQVMDIHTMTARLKKLSFLLASGDSKSERLAKELRAQALGRGYEHELDEIMEAIEDAEFERAGDIVKALIGCIAEGERHG